MVLLQTILLLILVYYGIKFLVKWLGPRLLSYAVKKTTERFGEQFGKPGDFGSQRQQTTNTRGHGKRGAKANPSKKVGEYIDFEEIE